MLFGENKLARLEDIQFETITDLVFRVDTGDTSDTIWYYLKICRKVDFLQKKRGWWVQCSEWVKPALASSKRGTHTCTCTPLPEELIASLSETQISRPTDERHSIRRHLGVKSAKPSLGCPPDFNIEAIFREVPVVRDGGVSEVQPALERLQPQRGLHLQGPPCPTCKLDRHNMRQILYISVFCDFIGNHKIIEIIEFFRILSTSLWPARTGAPWMRTRWSSPRSRPTSGTSSRRHPASTPSSSWRTPARMRPVPCLSLPTPER